MEMSVADERLEYLRRSVFRTMVRGDDEVHAGIQVVRDLGGHDVSLVARAQSHDELHLRYSTEIT